jgi:fatty acid desaturase
MDYHIEHHMYAAIPYYNLPKLNKLIRDDLPRPKGLLMTWIKDIFPALKQQKPNPGYVARPVLPDT